ncbi:MAG: SDR family oxidoreductase [Novosphingobium sp.]
MEIAGKIALITGGGGGIGGAIGAELARRGARVAVADRDRVRAQAVADRIVAQSGAASAFALTLDVTCQEDFDAARAAIEAEFGPLDILVSNAGVGHTEPLGEISAEAFQWVHDVNLVASVRALKAFLPGMKARGAPAHVLLTCSITALRPFATQAAYTSSKAALLNLGLVLEIELQGTAIGVSALCPGIVATDLGANARAAKPEALRIPADDNAAPSPLSQGMSANAVARAAVDAIAAGRFYVFPTVDYSDTVAAEQRAVLAAMGEQAQAGYAEPAFLTLPLR